MNTKLIRTLHPEVRVINAQDGTIEYVASDESLDQYQEVILARGWNFADFQKNAPFVDSHDYSTIAKQLGKVTDFRVEKNQLIERVQYAVDVPACVLAKFAFDMVSKGYLKAVSVGFMPDAAVYNGTKEFATVVQELKMDAATASQCRCIYTSHRQIELSQCIIGANPNALARAFKDGAVKEEQMVALGFADADAMDFLNISATASEKPEFKGFMESLYRLECKRLFLSGSAMTRGSSSNDPSPGSRAGGGGSNQHAKDEASRDEFLRKLKQLAGN